MINKEIGNGEGQRKEVYYAVWAYYRKRQSKHFCPSWGTDMSFKSK
jgi:hypothetical protein